MTHDQALNTYMDVKWKIKRIVSDAKIPLRSKFNQTRHELKSLREVGKPDQSKLGIKGRIYVFLLGNELAAALILLELAMLKDAKRLIPSQIVNLFKYHFLPAKLPSSHQRKGRTAYIFMVPDLGNIGDLAIGLAQKSFLEKNLHGYDVVEITHSNTYESARVAKKHSTVDDIIFLTGGGNMGTIYKDAEQQRRFLIRLFKRNRIYQFPQSVFFERSSAGAEFLAKSKRIYSQHTRLTLIARDQTSYNEMKSSFPQNEIALHPDTVISLAPVSSTEPRRNQVVLSIRRDIESGLDGKMINSVEHELLKAGIRVIHRDTNVDNMHHQLNEREGSISAIWDAYLSSRLVITDRLHGVIFCAITGTPCVAMDNLNGKVRNLIETWLQQASYITAVDCPSTEEILEKASAMLSKFPQGAAPITLDADFERMAELFKRTGRH
ncbi:polysaccharide pyruvyl transferase family protein [Stenotrophomonas sp. SMYL11]|uniref:polysaccharide pyruvyl transferase family protein n=1 Tax=Stenotrophomonas sp. SMYL11 TaxID=3076042 RepID=UPI002E7787C6|nr:polysaccharide pyruvyl transferase family protein [Stenotrophomonas sp. SMYL11]